jgi:hypothetical protein
MQTNNRPYRVSAAGQRPITASAADKPQNAAYKTEPIFALMPPAPSMPSKSLLARLCCCWTVDAVHTKVAVQKEKPELKTELKINSENFSTPIVKADFSNSSIQTLAQAAEFLKCLDGQHLDLSEQTVASINTAPAELWSAIASLAKDKGVSITAVSFPEKMERIHAEFKQLTGLKALTLPAFIGQNIDVRDFLNSHEPELNLYAPTCLTQIVMHDKTKLRVNPHHFNKVTVERQQKSGTINKNTLANHIYLHAEKIEKYNSKSDVKSLSGSDPLSREKLLIHLNGKANFSRFGFSSAQFIVCRHLCVQWLIDRARSHASATESKLLQSAKSAKTKSFNYDNYLTTKAISKNTPAITEKYFRRIITRFNENYMIDTPCWGQFLEHQLLQIKPGENRHFYLTTCNHAMSLELRCKLDESGKSYYVVNFYDSNQTATHKRLILMQASHANFFKIENWISTPQMQSYFAELEDNPIIFATAINPLALEKTTQKISPTRTIGRWIDGAEKIITIGEFRQLIWRSYHSMLEARMQTITGPEHAKQILINLDKYGYSPLDLAISTKNSKTFATLMRLILTAEISQNDKINGLKINRNTPITDKLVDVYCSVLSQANVRELTQKSRRLLQQILNQADASFIKVPDASKA